MFSVRSPVPALAALAAAALGAGCGLGPGESSSGDVTLTVTRDYGAEQMVEASESDPPESETVLRMLDREAEITTRYGGGFVQSIEGLEGAFAGGRSLDWFFYVNGIESPVGSADRPVAGGDRVWWDYRDWTEAMRVPAVVGSWPEPFLQASAGEDRLPVRVVCAGTVGPCEAAQDALADAGVSSTVSDIDKEPEGEAVRVLVGRWTDLSDDPVARLLARGPGASGVFARPDDKGIDLLDVDGDAASSGSGLVAATRDGEDPPTWVVTGIDPAGVVAAAELLGEEELMDRYAIGLSGGKAIPLPVRTDP
jgi:hypothetical protein